MKKLTVLIALFFFLADIRSQDTLHISLEKLLQEVETNYPSILQYQYNIQSLESKAEGATAWMPPTFSAGLMRFPYDFSTLDDRDDPMNQAGISFSLEQMIPNPGKLKARKRYISSLTEIEKSNSAWTLNILRREAKILYYSRYVNDKKLRIVEESEALLRLVLTTAEAKFSNNQSQLQTIYKARARIAELNNMTLMLNSQIAESNIGLNILMVSAVYTPFAIDTLIVARDYANTLVDTSRIVSRSDINGLTNSIQSMRLEQEAMSIGNRPDFGVRAEREQMFGMPDQWSLMGMVTIPIVPWSSKMYSSETKSIGFQIEAMEQERLTMELMAKRMLSEKHSMLKYETTQYENYRKEIIPAYENNLEANLLAYRQNTGDFFVLLDAWEMLLMKKTEMYDMLFNILKSEAEYEYEREIR